MSPIEKVRKRLFELEESYARDLSNIPAYKEFSRSIIQDDIDQIRAQLAALDALIAERDALKARAEKTEALYRGMCQQAMREVETADALRKALEELLRMYCLEKRVQGHPCPENISTLSPMYAALHGTAKQEPHARTCGECAHNNSQCDCPPTKKACWGFQPRAVAQKGNT